MMGEQVKLNVRPATQQDADAACDVIRRSITECCVDDHGGDRSVLNAWLRNKTPAFMRGVILTPGTFSFVACVDGQTIGFASALASGEVTLCYVAPPMRFTGVGKALLAAIEAHAHRTGIDALHLESTRTARPFYLRNGFVAEGLPARAFGMEAQPMRKACRPTRA
ncbi:MULTISPECIES: GNAT family N-acetyltransferase [unclassified Acidovorax]|uniref:GNAT family N-acetyltransferase n=1 Tax=unclassified Acidovorax TaxID=2684926 RepID=UPI0028834F28|nr:MULTISPECIES: GNAT family N-acetyltransferase [unclassified Acidovorax]